MSRWRTAHKKAAKAWFRAVYQEAYAFHERHVAKLHRTGKLHKLNRSGYVLRNRRRAKANLL